MTAQELETVAAYVKDHLPGWLERSSVMTSSDYFRLSERIVRVEEGLLRVEEAIKNQNLLTDKRFEAMDKRFEDLIHQMDKRFDAIDKRFGWMMGIMTTLITGLGVLITVYRFLDSAG